MEEPTLKSRALDYHALPRPGKLATQLTKPTNSQDDLSLAYSPGVAEPVLAIQTDPQAVYRYTTKGNLVGVITNGTAVLGLGNVGSLAAKPVMEGKGVLFKRFADLDVFDIEIDTPSTETFIETVKAISPTFGGINLEDIKAPECFYIEEALMKALSIPVFHDDQHGTAIVVAAALLNALDLQHKALKDIKIVCVGAGAAGIASMRLLCALGATLDNLLLLDTEGVIHAARPHLNPYKRAFARTTACRTLADAIKGADIFIGLSKANLLSAALLKLMADRPIVFALANPEPEIRPEAAYAVRRDVIIATGRSDYPNQVNNVLCFPYIFKGAFMVRARSINQSMHIAAVHAIRKLVYEAPPREVKQYYPYQQHWTLSNQYILPTPIDPRLKDNVTKAVADAAIKTRVAIISEYDDDKK